MGDAADDLTENAELQMLEDFLMGKEYIEITCNIKHETELALLINDGTKDAWLPKSQVEDQWEEGSSTIVLIPEWLAMEKGLI